MTISTMDNQTETIEEIDIKEIEFLESIGKGSFGVVYKALWKGHTVAVKRVETESEVNAFHNEVQQLARVNHENIIHLYGACMSDAHKCLVIEFADGGSLYHLLHSSHKTEYNLAHGISWLLQCAKAVSYLHAIHPRPLLHRDLKPPNLLLTKGAKVLKLCDFGTACELSTIMSDNRGSAAWMAPEVFEGKMYTEKCDVYSWGIILWEVLTRRVPFEDLGLAVRIMWAVHQKQRPPLISGCPKLLENLMKRCWDHNHARRPRMEEVVEKVSIICKFLKGADEPINNPPSDDSMTDSFRSPCIGSSECHTSRDVSNLSTLPNEVPPAWGSCGSERAYPAAETGSSSPQLPPPAISPNVSGTVVVGGENLPSPYSSGHSEEMEPIFIMIPNSEPPNRTDITVAPSAPKPGRAFSIFQPPIGSAGPISPPPVTMRLTPCDPQASIRRRSAEVSPQATSYREGSHHGHRRSSSYGTLGNKVDDGEGGFTGYKEGETPTTEYQIPNYEMDPNMRAPGGSLGRVENALKYRDFPTLTTVITPTNSLSSSVTPTLPPSSSLAPTHPAPSSLTSTHPLSSLHRPTHPALSSLTTSHPSSYTPTTHPPLPSISLLSYQTPIPTPIFTPIPCSSPSSAPIATSSSMPWLRPPYPFVRSKSDGRGHIGEGGGGGGGGLCTEGGVADDKELGAYWELLDSELRPIEPVLSCPESLSIFSEHKEMAKKYLILQQEIFNLQHKKGVLEEKLSQAEKLEHLGNQRYQDKIRELENKRENLRRTRSKLRQQLEQICLRQEEQQQRQNHQEDVTGDGISHNHPLSPP